MIGSRFAFRRKGATVVGLILLVLISIAFSVEFLSGGFYSPPSISPDI